jgi:hypothetical protein
MFRQPKKLAVTLAAIAAMALGAGVVTQAGATSNNKPQAAEKVTLPDRDNVQSGDQTTPDTPAASSSSASAKATAETPEPAGNTSEKQGAESPEKPGAESESAPNSDGPGGHADEAGGGNAAADHQFNGVE